MMLKATELWKKAYPGASVGCMVLNHVLNPKNSEILEDQKRKLEIDLCAAFQSKEDIASHSFLTIYGDYYKKYKKTYHVRPQLESIVFKGKSIPAVAGLVEAMFMAELKNCLLTAGHDYSALALPLRLDIALGNEKYIGINGKEQSVKEGDMIIADGEGIISSIVHGPDLRTRIQEKTKKALFVIYAPQGIPEIAILEHLSDIYSYVKLFAHDAEIELQTVYKA